VTGESEPAWMSLSSGMALCLHSTNVTARSRLDMKGNRDRHPYNTQEYLDVEAALRAYVAAARMTVLNACTLGPGWSTERLNR
jgi:hypothetical protein